MEKVRSLVGQRMTGGGVRRTVMVNLHSARPQSFEATQVTMVSPTAKKLPEGGTQVTGVPAGLTSGAGYSTRVELEQVVTVKSSGHRIWGGLPWPFTTRTGNSQR